MSAAATTRALDEVQRWMQAVIMHPDGVEAGIASEAARREIAVAPAQVDEVIRRSLQLTSIERLRVYANAYYARLLECLREEFPALVHALGEKTFDGFAFGYLQAHPSRSYTLANLARHFPRYLAATRPNDIGNADDGPSWPDFLIDLATVERTYSEVFSGRGVEGQDVLEPDELGAISPEDWPRARLIPSPGLTLLTLRYPVHEYISAVRHQREAVMPAPAPTYLIITRRDFVVRRCAVPLVEFELLSSLVGGGTIADCLEAAENRWSGDFDQLVGNVRTWFREWSAASYFQRIEVDSRPAV